MWSGTLAPHLLDLNPHLTAEERGQYFPIYLENNSVGEALVGLPQMGDVGLLYYRPGPAGGVRIRGAAGYVERAGGDGGGDPGGGTGAKMRSSGGMCGRATSTRV